MRRALALLLGIAALGSGCGGGESARQVVSDSDEARPPAPAAPPPAANVTEAVLAPEPHARGRPLSRHERKVLRMLARSIGDAIDRYDANANLSTCKAARWAACLDNAWKGIVTDLDWPPYYLRLFDTHTRQCKPLSDAVNGVYGFNNGARQLDYSDPDVDASLQRSGHPALVDGLRPVPSELLDAAAGGCR
jgi:hypothetical protein